VKIAQGETLGRCFTIMFPPGEAVRIDCCKSMFPEGAGVFRPLKMRLSSEGFSPGGTLSRFISGHGFTASRAK